MAGDAPCPYCGSAPVFRPTSAHIYGGRDYGPVWECRPCGAYVGMNRVTHLPHGTVAHASDRALRKRAHASFDRIWKDQLMRRHEAYRWLAGRLALDPDVCHIGMMHGDMLQHVIDVSDAYYEEHAR